MKTEMRSERWFRLMLLAVFVFAGACLDSNHMSDHGKRIEDLIEEFKSEHEKYNESNSRVCELATTIHKETGKFARSAGVPEPLLGEALLDLLTNTDAMGGWLDHLQRSHRRPVVFLSLPTLDGNPDALVQKLRAKLTFPIELNDGSSPTVPETAGVREFRIQVESCSDVPMARQADYVSFCFRAKPAPQTYYGVFSIRKGHLQNVVWCGYIS